MALEHADREPALRDRARGGEAGHAAADDRYIDPFQ
jgi:hypothetical protein